MAIQVLGGAVVARGGPVSRRVSGSDLDVAQLHPDPERRGHEGVPRQAWRVHHRQADATTRTFPLTTVGLTGLKHVQDASGEWGLTGLIAPFSLVS